jgi:diketogulonate reductase-like aldo/keto reductase
MYLQSLIMNGIKANSDGLTHGQVVIRLHIRDGKIVLCKFSREESVVLNADSCMQSINSSPKLYRLKRSIGEQVSG